MDSYVEQARQQIARAEYKLQETPVIPEVYELFSEIIKSLQLLNVAIAEQARLHGTAGR